MSCPEPQSLSVAGPCFVYNSHMLMGVGSVPSHRDRCCSTRYLRDCRNCQPFRDIYELSHQPVGLAEYEYFGESDVVRRVWGEVAVFFFSQT